MPFLLVTSSDLLLRLPYIVNIYVLLRILFSVLATSIGPCQVYSVESCRLWLNCESNQCEGVLSDRANVVETIVGHLLSRHEMEISGVGLNWNSWHHRAWREFLTSVLHSGAHLRGCELDFSDFTCLGSTYLLCCVPLRRCQGNASQESYLCIMLQCFK